MTGANVQIDNGNYARIHNDILEALAGHELHASEFRCVIFLLRCTYGWGKAADAISYSQWEDGTKLQRRTLRRTLANLVEKRIVNATDNGNNRPKTWGFNKYFEQWELPKTMRTQAHSLETNYAHTGARNYAHTGAPQKKERQLKIEEPAMEQTPSSNRESSSSFSDVCIAYESNGFGTITAMTSELINDDVDTFTAEWCLDAMKIAIKRGKRNWAYVSGILKNWHAEGRPDETQAEPVTVGGVVEGLVWD